MTDLEAKASEQDGSDQHIKSGSMTPDSMQIPNKSQGLEKNFNVVSLAGIGLVVGNVWPALGGSLLASIANGGAPGVIYEFLVVSVCYFNVAAIVAELASALPSSAGVLLWASITSGRRCGRVVGYFAGYWNFLAWVFAEASMSLICGMYLPSEMRLQVLIGSGNVCIEMYARMHPNFVAETWYVTAPRPRIGSTAKHQTGTL